MSGYDERKMKELANRLVAMSPEPPPFPEEVIVTQRNTSKPSPILMFAGAAVVVLIVAAIPLLLFGGRGGQAPVGTTTTTDAVETTVTTEPATSTTEPTTSTSQPETTTTTTQPVELRGAVIYLTQSPENSFTGNPALVPFRTVVSVPASTSELESSLRLVTNPELVVPEGFQNMIPSGVEVLAVDASDNHVVVVEMNEAFVEGAGGLLADFTMLNQLIYTATQFGEISEVLFTVGGEPVTAFGSEGLDISQPLGKDAFLDQVNSVIVDSPADGSGDEPLIVSGFANVFEATVSLEVVDADGNVVYEDFTTATCGTGCWGGFSFEVDYPFVGEETIRVFWYSPEDGEPSDVVSIPVLWDDEDGWDLLP
jgi:spore germination protein GerM